MAEITTQRAYWATLKTEDMLPKAFTRIDQWFKHVRAKRLPLWRRSLREYYAGSETGGKTGTAGEQDEFTTMKVNHLHSLGERVITAIAGQPPTFQAQAKSSDHEATAQTVVANGLVEDKAARGGLDEFFPAVTRYSYCLSEGWGSTEWDSTLGDPYVADPDTGAVVTNGDVRVRRYTPENVVRDANLDDATPHQWFILRRWENRWDVLAQVLAKAPDEQTAELWRSRVLAAPSKTDGDTERPCLVDPTRDDESDEIAVWELRHDRTPALPQGRRCIFVDEKVWLSDGKLPYRDLGVYRLVPEYQIGTERGYSQSHDLLAPQHVLNSTYSTILSAQSTLGHPVIWTKPGSTNIEDLGAFSLLKSEEKPEGLTLVNTPAEIFKFGDQVKGDMELISGVNAVARGNLDAAGKLSGSAYAIIDAKFLESVVGLQRGYRTFASNVATSIIWLYQDFATVEHTLQIVGKSNRAYVKTFTGEGLRKVSRVDVEMGDPLSRTATGRLQLAEMLLKITDPTGKPLISTLEQFMGVVTTGRVEPLTEGTAKEMDNIKAENEVLGDGGEAVAVAIDNHPTHIEEHSAVLASPEARQDQAIVNAVLKHIQEHMDLWTSTDPRTLAARGIPPPPMPPPPPGMVPPGAPGATTGTPAPAPGASTPTVPELAGPPGAMEQPNMPQMPQLPSGERAPGPQLA